MCSTEFWGSLSSAPYSTTHLLRGPRLITELLWALPSYTVVCHVGIKSKGSDVEETESGLEFWLCYLGLGQVTEFASASISLSVRREE